jgi:PAS domain S-box-containing protein
MTALAEGAAAINASLRQEEVIQTILGQSSQALQVEAVSLALIDFEKEELEFVAATGQNSHQVVGLRIKLGQGVAGWVAKEGQGVIVPDAANDPRFLPEAEERPGHPTRAIACAPLRAEGEVIGVLEAINPTVPFGQDALLVLEGIGNMAGSALQHAQLFEQVEVARRRYHELFEDSIDPILITDLDGGVIEANRQAVLFSGMDANELLSWNIQQLHQVDWNVVGGDFENLTSGDPLSYESDLITRTRGDVAMEVYVRRVEIDGVPRLQWLLRDITERKNLDRLREDLVSMIYHDLSSPLTNVISGLDVLSSILPEDADPALKSVLDIALRSTERVQRLASSLLDTGRLEAGQRIGNPVSVSPVELVQDAIETVLPNAQSKGQQIRVAVSEGLPQVMVDVEMIQRVIINLLENAVKFTPSGGNIGIGAKKQGNWLHVWVEDDGIGIAPQNHARIFEKFARVRGPGTESTKGLGLGLAFCKLAVEAHGGIIWVESELDQGARFVFTIPVA